VIQSPRPHVLREYSLIADGERGALIGPDGAISWLCAPRWDSPAGLFTEEYDVHQRQLRGNLPQAFVHAGLLECAAALSART
jgi:GH15 family glucan-1,4-alpha-glucosidase